MEEGKEAADQDDQVPLFDCIFMAGLYHDLTSDRYVPFTRDCFPPEVRNRTQLSKRM